MTILRVTRPTSQAKSYIFQIGDESWQILVKFVLDHCADFLPKEDHHKWFGSSVSVHIKKKDALRVADRLQELLDQGVVQSHQTEVRTKHPGRPCIFCKSSGIINKKRGKECEPCHGEGIFRPVDFSEREVRALIEFIRNCSGFNIWPK